MKIAMLLLIIGAYGYDLSARQNHISLNTRPVFISGNIEHGNTNDTFQVLFWKEYINHLNGVYRATVQLDEKGNFSIELPAIAHIARIVFLKRGTEFANLGSFGAEPGDSIYIQIGKIGDDYQMVFSGRGYEKYRIHSTCLTLQDEFNRLRGQADTDIKPALHFEKIVRIADSMRLVVHDMLAVNRKMLSPAAYKFLEADCVAYMNHIVPLELRDSYRYVSNLQVRNNMSTLYYQFLKSTRPVDDTFSAWSMEYLYTCIAIEQTKLFISASNNSYSFTQLYHNLKKNYRGLLREKILMTALIDPAVKADCAGNDQEVFDACLKDAYTNTKTTYIKSELGQLMNIFSKGQPAYDFTLEDNHGDLVSLHDFRGKVVLMDLWFTGCSGCMQFADKMKREIMPSFAGDTSLKVVSISSDERKGLWLQSLSKNIYSAPNDINLYTGGLSFYDVPFIQYYQIQGVPFVLLIDKNGDISTRISGSQKTDEIISLIKNALNAKSKNLGQN